MDNYMNVTFPAISQNESFARIVISAFVSQLNPTIEELADVKTAVSEAVTNSVIHGYKNKAGEITLAAKLIGNVVEIEVIDKGVGIENIALAREPFYTTMPDMERSGMGFTVMETFMDSVDVVSEKGGGTLVKMRKAIARSESESDL